MREKEIRKKTQKQCQVAVKSAARFWSRFCFLLWGFALNMVAALYELSLSLLTAALVFSCFLFGYLEKKNKSFFFLQGTKLDLFTFFLVTWQIWTNRLSHFLFEKFFFFCYSLFGCGEKKKRNLSDQIQLIFFFNFLGNQTVTIWSAALGLIAMKLLVFSLVGFLHKWIIYGLKNYELFDCYN